MQPPHAKNQLEVQFEEWLPEKEKRLHSLATQMLGSSYFMGKTHAYVRWAARLKANPAPSPPAKA